MITYKQVLRRGLIKEASKLFWLPVAQKAALNRSARLFPALKQFDPILSDLYKAMSDLPRYNKLPSVFYPKRLKSPVDNVLSRPLLQRAAKRLGFSLRTTPIYKLPDVIQQRQNKMVDANLNRKKRQQFFLQGLRKLFPSGFRFSSPPELRVLSGYNNAGAQLKSNLIRLGDQNHRGLDTLAHQLGHIFDTARDSRQVLPPTLRELRAQLYASASGLRALKKLGIDPQILDRVRRSLKAAYKSYKYDAEYALLRSKTQAERLARMRQRKDVLPKYPTAQEYPRIKRLRQQIKATPIQDTQTWHRLNDLLFNRKQAINQAIYSRQNVESNYQRALKQYLKNLTDRGLPKPDLP